MNPPASAQAIVNEEQLYGQHLPEDYVALLRLSNGLHTDGCFNLLEVEGVVERNRDDEVQKYLPGYFMIGDDGGGTAMLIKLADGKIHEVGMGVMDEESMQLSAGSLEELLTTLQGKLLVERGRW